MKLIRRREGKRIRTVGPSKDPKRIHEKVNISDIVSLTAQGRSILQRIKDMEMEEALQKSTDNDGQE